MASSLFINTLQVNFESLLAMVHARMVRVFKYLENTGLRGFLEGTTYVFESAVTEFFSNARVIARTVVSTVRGQKLVITEEIFSGTFKLPNEGMPNFANIQNETITEMRTRFSATEMEDIASNAEGEASQNSQQVPLEVTKPLAGATEQNVPNPKKRKHKGEAKKTQPKPVATQEDSETDSCPLVQRRCRKKQVSELSNSKTTNSIHLMHCLKRRRTQRQNQQSGWTGVTILTQLDPILASVTEPQGISDGHFSQGGGNNHFDEVLELNARTEHGGGKYQEVTTDKRNSSPHDSIPLVPTEGEGNIADDEQLDPGSHEPTKIVSAQDMQMNADPASVDEYCQLLITSTRNKVSAQLTIFEDWVCQEVRLKDIYSFDSMVNIEEQLLEWGETEDITELSERRSFILYKLFELELENIYLAHLANFKTAAHRHYRELVGLPFITPAFSEFYSLPKPFPALELDNLAGDGQNTAHTKGHQIEQSGNNNTAMTSYEHQAQETEPTSQTDEPRNKGNEHQAPDEPRSAPRIAHNLEDHSTITPPPKIVSDHQDPESSNLHLVVTVPQDSSTLQFLSTAAQSLDFLSTRLSSLDLSFARIRDDTNITRHHTTKILDELKSTADGFDINIDVLERTLTQRMVDKLAMVKSQLAAIFEDLKDTGVAKRGKVLDQVVDREKGKPKTGRMEIEDEED
ncbi:hypothetical protein F511_23845 [Dorcoceras hygrometricum]|uniref:Uncharacterized protein n=1 Tax=Dorcoceras hygrometricum TaxID=472368 RepID=A0A2Z7C6Q1_9LAMI|nr:hypothetical protein F511_23845 [Dorcoceras hygrometricum]